MHTQKGRKWGERGKRGERGERNISREKGSEKEGEKESKRNKENVSLKNQVDFYFRLKRCVCIGALQSTTREDCFKSSSAFGKLVPGVGHSVF